MDINAFLVFRTVAAEGSVTKAAERLNYVQSNITARIQQLEKEIGVTLFHRDYRKMTLTSAGQLLLPYANRLIETFNEAKEAVTDTSIPRGALTIGAMDSAAAVWLPKVVSAYHNQYPLVDLNIFTAPTEAQIRAVLAHEIDGAFVDGPVSHPDLVNDLEIDERLVLVCAKARGTIELEDVLEEPLLTPFSRCVYLDRWQGWLNERGHRVSKVMEFGTLDGILHCIENGFGITVVPYAQIQHHETQRKIQWHRIPEPYGTVPTVFIHRRDSYVSGALRALIDIAHLVVMES